MIVTPHDFHRLTNLISNGPIINLEGKSGVALVIELLGRAYFSEHIRYLDSVANFRPLSQATH